jgi:hypothetical protein
MSYPGFDCFSTRRLTGPGLLLLGLWAMVYPASRDNWANPPARAASKVQPEPGHFYTTTKPYTRWWWFASLIKEEDIGRQLDWLKQNNFGGVEIAWVYPLNIERYRKWYDWITEEERQKIEPRQEWLSPEWSEIVAYAKQYGDRIGLGVDFTFGSAWPFGDSHVTREDSTKVFGDASFQQRNIISWEYPKQGLVINHLNRAAFERYGKRMGSALAAALKGARSGLFCDSWEVETNRIWTDGFEEAFQKRYGYDVRTYMERIFSNDGDKDVRYDYLKLVSEYVIGNFYEPFTALAHRLGAFSRAQCAGSPTDILTAYASIDVPETEALLYEPAYSRIVASAAALAGKKDVTSETFTCSYGFPRLRHKEEQVADLKLVADAVFANGVNHVIWHGTPFNAQGARHDGEFYASVHVGPNGNLAPDLPGFNRYLEKVSAFLSKGRTYSDVAAYLPIEDGWMAGPYPKELLVPGAWAAFELRYVQPAEELKGWAPLWINNYFLKRGKVENGVLHVGEVSFSSLYIDVEHLDREALSTILRIARTGFPVCLKRKPKEPGLRKSARFERELNSLMALKNVSSEFIKISRRKPLVAGDNLPDFWCRVENGEQYIFFSHPLAQNLHLPLKYGQSLIDRDAVRPVQITVNGKTTDLRLLFKPYQSIVVKVGRAGRAEFVDITYHPRIPKQETPAP